MTSQLRARKSLQYFRPPRLTLENIGGENITSLKENESEKSLGMQVSNEFNWKLHVDKLMTELNKKIGLIRRIRNRVPRRKLIMIAEAIFSSKIRYGIALYLNPVSDPEDLKDNI